MSERLIRRQEAKELLVPGAKVDCVVRNYQTGGIAEKRLVDRVSTVHGGGFFGRVLELESTDAVIKTAQPDPFHDFLRRVNWRGSFPPQTEETAAKQDHLTTRIINKVLPCITYKAVSSPASLGYTFFKGVGYAQVLERMRGRPPRFDSKINEVGLVREMQYALLNLGIEFGLEHVGQIHPNNPFAFTNLWIDDFGGVIWLDTLSAFRHTAFVLPAFYFSFHKDIRNKLADGRVTFNRIHTDRFRQALEIHRSSFPQESLTSLEQDLALYDQVLQEGQTAETGRTSFLNSCVRLGWLTSSQADDLTRSPVKYAGFVAELTLEPLAELVLDKLENSLPARFIRDRDYRVNLKKILGQLLKDPDFRRDFMVERFTFAGINEAFKHGILSKEELAQIKHSADLSPQELRERKGLYSITD